MGEHEKSKTTDGLRGMGWEGNGVPPPHHTNFNRRHPPTCPRFHLSEGWATSIITINPDNTSNAKKFSDSWVGQGQHQPSWSNRVRVRVVIRVRVSASFYIEHTETLGKVDPRTTDHES